MAQIRFWRGTQAQYTAIGEANNINAYTLYFITDAYKIYLDGNVIASNSDAAIGGDISALETKLTTLINTEVQNRKDAIDALRVELGDKIANDIAKAVEGVEAKITVLEGKVDTEVGKLNAADGVLQTNIDALDKKLSDLVLSGGAMVFTGSVGSVAEFEAFDSLNPGSTFVSTGDFVLYGNKVETGDMIVVTEVPETGNPSIVIVQANLSSAIQSDNDLDLGNDYIVIGVGGKKVKSSTITASALASAIANANNAVLKTGDHTMAGKLTATGGFVGNVSGSATSLANSRNFSISGGATAEAVGFDGTSAVELVVTSLDASKLSGDFATDLAATTAKLGVVKLASSISSTETGVASGKQVFDAIKVVGDKVGASTDVANESGTLYARIAKLKNDMSAVNTRVDGVETNVGAIQSQLTWIVAE